MRICHVLAPAFLGGLEQVVRHLASAQVRRSQVVVVAVLDRASPAPPALAEIQSAGADLRVLRVRPRRYLGERGEVRAALSECRPDIVHTHGYRPDVLYRDLVQALDLPLVTTSHGFTGGNVKNRLYEWVQRRSFRRFAAVVAVSRPMVDMLVRSGVAAQRVHLIPNAVPPPAAVQRAQARAELGLEEGGFHIGWIGRISWEKGPDVFLSALESVAELPLRASIIGDGELAAPLRKRTESMRFRHLRWHGSVPDASRLLTAFDVVVLSSRTEGTPLVLLEAIACRVPVVASSVGGIPDVVGAGESLLVPPGDPSALAAAIREVWAEPAQALQRAEAAFRRFQASCSIPSWVMAYDRVYSLVLRSTKAGQRGLADRLTPACPRPQDLAPPLWHVF